jgi:methionyl-tRNA formyltransferase
MNTVLLVGKGSSALTALESLAEKFRVIAILRDIRQGTAEDLEIQRRAAELEVPILTGMTLEDVERAVTEYRPDCIVLSGYDRILRPSTLGRARFVNVHFAPLPKYRGRTFVNWAIINGETESAITIHVIAEGMDAGNILYQGKVAIGPHDTPADIFSRLNEIQRRVLGETVERHLRGDAGIPQDEAAASYVCTRVPEDGEINWSESTAQIYALIRALSPPFPAAHTYLKGRRISIISAAPVENAPHYVGRVPGRVVARSNDTGCVDVLTGDGVLRIREVMTEDSGVHPASAIIRSTKQTLGLQSADLLQRIEELSSRLDRLEQKSITLRCMDEIDRPEFGHFVSA